MLEDFLKLVDPSVHQRSGGVMYSGRSAFSGSSSIYLLGLNPAGSPNVMMRETVQRHITHALARREDDWSEYVDVSWRDQAPGTAPMQRRIRHLLKALELAPRSVPASNVVFVRAAREVDLAREKADLLDACWPVHEAVISQLKVRVVMCMHRTAGEWVRQQLGAHALENVFVEDNQRRWTSTLHSNRNGTLVATLTHPAIAAWDVQATNPSPLLKGLL